MERKYQELAGGYSYCKLRVGLTVRNPQGREVYFQPGDCEFAILETIAALEEYADISADRQNVMADIALGDYFS